MVQCKLGERHAGEVWQLAFIKLHKHFCELPAQRRELFAETLCAALPRNGWQDAARPAAHLTSPDLQFLAIAKESVACCRPHHLQGCQCQIDKGLHHRTGHNAKGLPQFRRQASILTRTPTMVTIARSRGLGQARMLHMMLACMLSSDSSALSSSSRRWYLGKAVK